MLRYSAINNTWDPMRLVSHRHRRNHVLLDKMCVHVLAFAWGKVDVGRAAVSKRRVVYWLGIIVGNGLKRCVYHQRGATPCSPPLTCMVKIINRPLGHFQLTRQVGSWH